jgi:hypothetical protein
MKYYLPDFPLDNYTKVFAGEKQRYATATDVKFIDDKFLIAAQFLNKTIHLIDYTNGFKVIDSIVNNQCPDLIDYKDGFILTSNMPYMGNDGGGASIFKIENNKIVFIEDFHIRKTRSHGCKIIDGNNFLISSTGDMNHGIFSINRETNSIENIYNLKKDIKDLDLIGNDLFLTVTQTRPNHMNSVQYKQSTITWLNYSNLEVIDEIFFDGQSDAIAIQGDIGFVTSQPTNEVICFKIGNLKLEIIDKIKGFDFPHGIDVYGDLIAVSNYGDNSIEIINYKERLNLV